jgi:hypothetical protein
MKIIRPGKEELSTESLLDNMNLRMDFAGQ